jgi:hypothetical protein
MLGGLKLPLIGGLTQTGEAGEGAAPRLYAPFGDYENAFPLELPGQFIQPQIQDRPMVPARATALLMAATLTCPLLPLPNVQVALDWLPLLPDFARGPRRPTPAREAFVQLAGDAAVRLDWTPTFADFARGPRRPNVGPAVAFTGIISERLDWWPSFPDLARGLRRPNVGPSAALVQLAGGAAVRLDWLVPSADVVRRALRAQHTAPAFVQLASAATVALDWLQPQADVFRRRPATWPLERAFVQLVTAAAVQLDWLPPIALPVRRHIRAQGAQAFVPIASERLDWIPQANQPMRARQLEALSAYAFTALVSERLDWAPQANQPTRRVVRYDPGAHAFVQLVVPVIVVPLSWAPMFPDFARGHLRPVVDGSAWLWLFEGVLPFTFGGASSIVSPTGRTTSTVSGGGGGSVEDNGAGGSSNVARDGSSEVENA